jgi:hypothetical protein
MTVSSGGGGGGSVTVQLSCNEIISTIASRDAEKNIFFISLSFR